MARKHELEEMTGTLRERLITPLVETTDEFSFYGQHSGDIGAEIYEREKDTGILELLELEMEKVNDALQQYRQGKYGICEVCRQPIEPGRLDRMINTTFCAHCAQERWDSFRRSAEEEELSTSVMSDQGETFQTAGYDYFETDDGSSAG